MDALQQHIRTVLNQLKDLPTTTRLLIGSLMVILAMSLFLVAIYAGRPDMSPLPIALDADARAEAVAYLETADIPHDASGDRIYVPTEQRYTVLARLTDEEAITGDQIDFESLLEEESPFTSERDKRRRYLVAKMNVLSRMVSEMDGVDRATVVIDQPQRSTPIGQPSVAPSASVSVLMRRDELSQSKVDAIARLVSGSHAELQIDRVQVVDARTGRAHEPRDDQALAGTRYLEVKLQAEEHISEQLERHLSYIPGVRVAVNAQVDTTRVESRRDSFDDPKIGPLAERNETFASRNVQSSAEPGVRSNTGVDISTGGGGGSETSREVMDNRLRPVFGGEKQFIMDHKGYPLKVNATVSIPRSHFVGIYQFEQGDESATPDETALQDVIERVTANIQRDVQPLVETDAIAGTRPGTVQVSMYHDFAVASFGGVGEAAADAASSTVSSLSVAMSEGSIIRSLALGGLALLSLLMMFMMVRRATVREPLPSAEELVGIPRRLELDGTDIVGEADDAPAPLEGVEIDEESVRRQQMLEQINSLAQETPAEAATLVRKWIRSDMR